MDTVTEAEGTAVVNTGSDDESEGGRVECECVADDDETDALIGYSLLNTGDQLHFLFNQQEKRLQILTSQSVSSKGELTRHPTMRNISGGYDIMASQGRQTGNRQIIFPCIYRNYLCFARVEL